MIELTNLTVRYGGRAVVTATLTIPRGQRVGLLGPNGAGKTTLLRALLAAVGLGGLGVVSASAGALPGDGLYGLKRGLEEVRLVLTIDPQAETDLLSQYADERLEEIRQNNAILRPLAEPRGVAERDYVALDYQGYFGGKALAEANRTKFDIVSEPRKGTLVEITFPTTRVLAE